MEEFSPFLLDIVFMQTEESIFVVSSFLFLLLYINVLILRFDGSDIPEFSVDQMWRRSTVKPYVSAVGNLNLGIAK